MFYSFVLKCIKKVHYTLAWLFVLKSLETVLVLKHAVLNAKMIIIKNYSSFNVGVFEGSRAHSKNKREKGDFEKMSIVWIFISLITVYTHNPFSPAA